MKGTLGPLAWLRSRWPRVSSELSLLAGKEASHYTPPPGGFDKLREYFGTILDRFETIWDHFDTILGPFWEY